MVKSQDKESVRSARRETAGILIGTIGLMLLLSVLSYSPNDIPVLRNQISPGSRNWIGPFGAWAGYTIFTCFGVAGYTIPFCIIGIGVSSVFRSARRIYPRLLWFVLGLFCLSGLIDMDERIFQGTVERLNLGGIPGGVIGEALARRLLGCWIGRAGAAIVFSVLLAVAIVRMLNLQVAELCLLLWKKIKACRLKKLHPASIFKKKPGKKRILRRLKSRPESKKEVKTALPEVDIRAMVEEQWQGEKNEEQEVMPDISGEPPSEVKREEPFAENNAGPFADTPLSEAHAEYRRPHLELLDPPVRQSKGMSASEIADIAEVLQQTLEEFGVEAKVTGFQQGPVVTCYEILPAPGVRVEKIKSLTDNIALKMHAESIRIQAPIPGKGVCGVEVPNAVRGSVFFREIVESRAFQSGKNKLPLVLGKDVSGDTMVYDLAKMPHLLIAGATGAGKSVCMNSILTGLLMKHTPNEMRLILVDPKTVEFHQYNNLPHLVVPVIIDAKKVALGLRWAIDEMERRFKWFRQAGVRDLSGFNVRAAPEQAELFNKQNMKDSSEKGTDTVPETLPYIVIVIDELADLMAIAQAEIEAGIARLAAKSRAAGIHMILATQRPDVKVITGTIKANFPVRIAFKVSQKVDSRTILDRMGADSLLGKGDMLVLPPGSDKLIRSQGAFTSDSEIDRVTNFWKEQCQPEFITDIHEKIETPTTELPEIETGGDDEIVEQAIEVIRQTKRASTSSLQRRLRIGYTRAARVMDLLEERGIVGPPDGAGPREILTDLDGEIPKNTGAIENESKQPE